MKHVLKILFCFLLLFILLPLQPTNSFASNISIIIDGEKKNFSPVIVDGRTLVPLRGVFESFGATVDWEDKTRTVTAYNNVTTLILKVGSKQVVVNGVTHTVEIPAIIINSTTYVPLRFIAETFGADVQWDGKTRTVIINYLSSNSYLLGNWVANFTDEEGTVSSFKITKVTGDQVEGTFGQFNRVMNGVIEGNDLHLKVYDTEQSMRHWLGFWEAPHYGKERVVKDLLKNYQEETYNMFSIVLNRSSNKFYCRWIGFNFEVDPDYNVTRVFLDALTTKYGEMVRVR